MIVAIPGVLGMWWMFVLAACAPAEPPGNVLLVVLDDVGTDLVGPYGVPGAPPLATIESLADQGVLFERAYAMPSCSPTRAALMTGRDVWRTGVGAPIKDPGDPALPKREETLPERLNRLAPGRVASAMVGKWHLDHETPESVDRPRTAHGFDHFRGTLASLHDYYQWDRIVDGVVAPTDQYATQVEADDAIALIAELPEPWLVVLSFHAAHAPLMAPPRDLVAGGLDPDLEDTDAVLQAMVQGADAAIGLVLAEVEAAGLATTVVVLGDNGSVGPDGKTTPYEGGVRIPLIIRGPGVAEGERSQALVSVTDLFPTLSRALGAPVVPGDGPLLDGFDLTAELRDPGGGTPRDHVWAGVFSQAEGVKQMVRGERFKLVDLPTGHELYDLAGRQTEGDDLLASGDLDPDAADAYAELLEWLPPLF